jgi:hypothetical protein
MKRLFRPEVAFFLLVWLIVLLAFRERGFYDPGSLWHVKVGEIILGEGMPQTDPFSYTFEGHKWVPQQWGAEVLMAWVHGVGGFDAMLLVFATGVAFLFTLIFRRCVQGGMGPLLAALVVGGCLFVGAFHYFVRPHMFTIALLGWTMMCVVDYERGRASVLRLVGLVPLYVLWTNLHGGVLGGTMTLGLAVGGWGLLFLANGRRQPDSAPVGEALLPRADHDGARQECLAYQPADTPGSPIKDWPTAFALVGIVLACLATPLVNPHGLEMIRIWQRIVGSKVLPQIITEHAPMDPTKPLGIAVVGLGLFYIVLLFGTLPKRPHVSWVIPLVWFALSFKGIRQAPLFAITAAVAIADLWRHTLWHRLLVKHGDGSLAWNPEDDPARLAAARGGGWWVIPVVAVAGAFSLQLARVPAPVVGYHWVRFDPDLVPVDLNPAVEKYADSVPPGTRIFNDVNLGGYLIYHAPKLKIFGDDRCELYGDEWLKNYVDALALPPEEFGKVFEGWQQQYGFERAVIMASPKGKDPTSIEAYLLAHPERWREVARGRRGVMFERVH